MLKKNYIAANFIILFYLLGMMSSFILQHKIIPFVDYDMYSKIMDKEDPYLKIEIWGIQPNGEKVKLEMTKYFRPWLKINLNHLYKYHSTKKPPRDFSKGFLRLYKKRAKYIKDSPQIDQILIYGKEATVSDIIKEEKNVSSRRSTPNGKLLEKFPYEL